MAQFYGVVVWIVGILFTTPPLYGWGKLVCFSACTFDWKIENISFTIVIMGGLANGSTIAIFYFYYKIYKTFKESTQNLNAHSIEDGVQTSSGRHETGDIRLLKTNFTVVCAYFITWGSLCIVFTVETAGCSIPREICVAAMFLLLTSRLVNPIIYGIMNPQFNAAFKKALIFGRYSNNQIGQG